MFLAFYSYCLHSPFLHFLRVFFKQFWDNKKILQWYYLNCVYYYWILYVNWKWRHFYNTERKSVCVCMYMCVVCICVLDAYHSVSGENHLCAWCLSLCVWWKPSVCLMPIALCLVKTICVLDAYHSVSGENHQTGIVANKLLHCQKWSKQCSYSKER